MNDLVRVLRGQRIDGRGTDEIMRLAADEIESLRRLVEVHKADAEREIGEANDLAAKCDALQADNERLRSRVAELVAASWKREAELNEQAANESSGYAKRLAEAERNEETLLGMIRHQRDVLRECLPYINESMAGRRPGRSADDIRAAVKALTSDSASGCDHEWRPYAFHPNGGPASYYCPLCRVNRAPTATEIQKSSVPDQPTVGAK